jgi:hypothetical protein
MKKYKIGIMTILLVAIGFFLFVAFESFDPTCG